jgi:alkylated DNA repair protein (DNA oxidative demethylase)
MTVLEGWKHLPRYLSADRQRALLAEVRAVIAAAPLYCPTMPRTARPFSVRMTNCGPLGWVSDAVGGYRYQPTHPGHGRAWPPIPHMLVRLWEELAGYPLGPEACLVNYYGRGAKLGSHRDADEEETRAPVLSVSLGDDAEFHVGGLRRSDPKVPLTLRSGDVFLLAGQARLAYHGIDRIRAGSSQMLPEGGRFNLTLRRVTRL